MQRNLSRRHTGREVLTACNTVSLRPKSYEAGDAKRSAQQQVKQSVKHITYEKKNDYSVQMNDMWVNESGRGQTFTFLGLWVMILIHSWCFPARRERGSVCCPETVHQRSWSSSRWLWVTTSPQHQQTDFLTGSGPPARRLKASVRSSWRYERCTCAAVTGGEIQRMPGKKTGKVILINGFVWECFWLCGWGWKGPHSCSFWPNSALD